MPIPPSWRRWPAVVPLLLGVLGSLAAGVACAPTADDSKLPPEVQDPKVLRTPAGALELYRAALLVLPGALDQVMVTGGILTDELAALPTPPGVAGPYTGLDSRQNPTGAGDEAYKQLHRLRAQLREARAFLGAYLTDTAAARGASCRGTSTRSRATPTCSWPTSSARAFRSARWTSRATTR